MVVVTLLWFESVELVGEIIGPKHGGVLVGTEDGMLLWFADSSLRATCTPDRVGQKVRLKKSMKSYSLLGPKVKYTPNWKEGF